MIKNMFCIGFVALLALVLLPGSIDSAPVGAQGTDDCPANVMLALARAGAACHSMESNQACYGNGALAATFQLGAGGVTFDAPGRMVDIAALRQIYVGAPGEGEPEWSVGILKIRADLVDTEQRNVTLLLFGDVEIDNAVPPTPEVMVSAIGTLYIRATPESDGEIVEQMGLRDTLMANGRTSDGEWLRAFLPGTSQLIWVSRGVVNAEGDLDKLEIVDETTPFYRPFQVFTLRTGSDDALCEGAPESGLLIQTPNTFTNVTLHINSITLRLAATAFIQAQPGGALVINILDGQAEVEASGITQFVPAGARVQIALDADLAAVDAPGLAEPYTLAVLEVLPLNNLPYRVSTLPALNQDEIDALVAEYAAPVPTPTPPSPDEDEAACVRKTHRDASLWAGPGMFYEVVNPIAAGTRVDPVLRVTDADGHVWWQLRNNNWIRADAVSSTGECEEVPLADTVRPPTYNTLALETCTTSNGPLREGQRVTIEFVPPAWPTLEEATEAYRVDPGRVTVDSRWVWGSASNPIKIAEERYIRIFSGYWTATAGPHRIVGKWLSYIMQCDVTVPVGP